MKRIAITMCAALVACALSAAEATPAIAAKPANNGWVLTTSKDKRLLVKVRNQVPVAVSPASYAHAIEMHWKYAPDSLGMPAEKVVGQIAKFEAAIDPIQGDRIGYLMMIVTGNGERTWLWYVADPKAFAAALNRLIPGHPYPIAINIAQKEPDWKTYRTMRGKIQ
ncbi:MAG: hypothetical protein QOK37_2739 [Thermoanaerobaculia bacterium]|jgi:hypothetical protein|nr:hypothetical protein [Thermoanaerobaculia bacterium]